MINPTAMALNGIGFDPVMMATLGYGDFQIEVVVTPEPIPEPTSVVVGGSKLFTVKPKVPGRVTIRITYNDTTTEKYFFMEYSKAKVFASWIAKTVRRVMVMAEFLTKKKITVRGNLYD